jgi:hypothetical protein
VEDEDLQIEVVDRDGSQLLHILGKAAVALHQDGTLASAGDAAPIAPERP